MHVVAFKSLPSSSVYINKVSFHIDTLPDYRSCLWWAETYFSLPCMKVVLCCILSHVQHTTHCHVFKVIYLSHAMWQCVTPQALLSSTACSRLSDSGEDAKDKAFSCLRFLNSADPTISEPGAGYFVYISLQEGDMGVYGIAVLYWAFFMQYYCNLNFNVRYCGII